MNKDKIIQEFPWIRKETRIRNFFIFSESVKVKKADRHVIRAKDNFCSKFFRVYLHGEEYFVSDLIYEDHTPVYIVEFIDTGERNMVIYKVSPDEYKQDIIEKVYSTLRGRLSSNKIQSILEEMGLK
jgi:hypothetical protein